MRLRGLLLVWHRRTGLVVALLLVLSAVTGAVLLFRDGLKRPPPQVAALEDPVALEVIVAAAVAAGDGSPATDLGLPQSPTDPYVVWLDDDAETEVYLDAHANIVETRSGVEGVTRWIFQLHTGQAIGPAGTWLSLVTAIGLVGLALSGTSVALARARRRGVRAKAADDRAAT